jgi:Protein of unknown function (DUF2892).
MTCNVGGIERPIRMIVGFAVLAIATFAALPASLMIVLYAIGAVAVVTGAIGFCPAWALLSINTCEVETARKKAA